MVYENYQYIERGQDRKRTKKINLKKDLTQLYYDIQFKYNDIQAEKINLIIQKEKWKEITIKYQKAMHHLTHQPPQIISGYC